MAYTKLTNAMRGNICRRMLDHKFDEQFKVLKERHDALGDRLYNELYDAETQETLETLGTGWFESRDNIHARLDGRGYGYDQFQLSGRRFFKHLESSCHLVLNHSHPITIEHDKIKQEGEKLREEKDRLRHQINATLAKFQSIGKLLEGWPEAQPFCSIESVSIATAVAIPVHHLNSVLGLPVENDQVLLEPTEKPVEEIAG